MIKTETAHDVSRGFINASAVRSILGIGDMTLWRWLNDPGLGFPQPIVIRGRRYFDRVKLDAWVAKQAEATGKQLPSMSFLTDPIQDYPEFVAALRKRRQDLGLSLAALEAKAGLAEGHMTKIENFDKGYGRAVGPVTLPLVLGALGCSIILITDEPA